MAATNSGTAPADACTVAIIGGGLTGLCAAFFLARQQPGWHVSLIRPAGGARRPVLEQRYIALSESSRRIFLQVGLWPDIEASSAAIYDIYVSDRGHGGHCRLRAKEQGLPAYGYVVDAAVLTAMLVSNLEKLANFAVIDAEGVVAIKPRAGGTAVTGVAGMTEAVDLLVLADGQASPIARQLGIQLNAQSYAQRALTATVTLAQAHQGKAYERFTSAGPIALLPLPGDTKKPEAALIWTLPPERAEQLVTVNESAFIEQFHDWFGQRAGPLTAVRNRALVPLAKVIAAEQVRSGVVLLGSAAHCLHPVAGQGFNLTLRDIAALVTTLRSAHRAGSRPGELAVLQAYARGRVADQQRTIALGDGLLKIYSSSNPLLVAGRNLALFGLDITPPLRNFFARTAAGLTSKGASVVG